jgi:hypothetical protein
MAAAARLQIPALWLSAESDVHGAQRLSTSVQV